MKEKWKQISYRDSYFYILWGIVCSMLPLFFNHVVRVDITDFPQHLHCARGILSENHIFVTYGTAYQSYLLFHIMTKVFHRIFMVDYELAAALLMACTSGASILLMRWGMRKFFTGLTAVQAYLVDFFCIGSILFENITGPLTGGRYYLFQGAPNPVHNPTYLMARPFGILGFIFFILFLKKLLAGEKCFKEAIGYGTVMAIGVYAKPTYAFVLLPAFAIVTLLSMWRKKSWKLGFCVFGATVPVIILLLWQFTICFPSSLPQWMVPRSAYSLEELYYMEHPDERPVVEYEETQASAEQTESGAEAEAEVPSPSTFGLYFGQKFGAMDQFNLFQVIAVTIAACAVPMLSFMLSFWYREIRQGWAYGIAMLTLLIGWIERFCFSNGPHGDFAWGYFGAIQIATVVALTAVIKSRAHFLWKLLITGIFGYQIVCGVIYFYHIYFHNAFFV